MQKGKNINYDNYILDNLRQVNNKYIYIQTVLIVIVLNFI